MIQFRMEDPSRSYEPPPPPHIFSGDINSRLYTRGGRVIISNYLWTSHGSSRHDDFTVYPNGLRHSIEYKVNTDSFVVFDSDL